MSNKPIIEVDVDSTQFKAFYDMFQQYSAQVEEMPDDWKKINGATKDAGKAVTDFAKYADTSKESLMLAAIQADAIGKSVGEAIKAQKEFASVARSGSSELEKMAKHAKSLGSEVFGIGKFLMKLSVIGLGATGIGALLSGLGMRDLARSAISNQGEARGIGVTPGQLSAFQTDFGRYVDPSILNRAADAQSDMRKIPYAMLATGQGLSAVQNQSPDELSMRMMQRAHDWWSNTPVSMRNAQTLQGTGLNQFMSFEEVRKLGAMTSGEFSEAQANYRKDSKSFNVSDKSTDAWYGFERELEAAGKVIKTDLTDRLSALAPDLQHFVDVFGKDAKKLVDDIFTPQNLQSLEGGIDKLTDYLGSPQFQQDLKDFAGLIGDVAGALRKTAKFLGIDTTSTNTPVDPNAAQAAWNKVDPTMVDKLGGWVQKRDNVIPSYFGDIEKANGLTPGLLSKVGGMESTGNPNGGLNPLAVNLKTGAKGAFQFMGPTAQQYGVTDPFDMRASATGAGKYLRDLQKRYGGDIRKELAAYNWGPGNVDKDIAQNGSNWESHLPAETRNYLNKITSALAQKSTVNLKVDVTNSTAARVAVSTNAAATGS